MKINRISIKWKIFFYLLFWACVLLVVLWFFQVVYYPRFYKQTRVSELSEAENDVLKVIGKDNLRNELESIAKKYNLCIIVTDEKMNSLCSVEMFLGCNIHKMSNTELEKCYKEAQNNNGELNIRDISKYRVAIGFRTLHWFDGGAFEVPYGSYCNGACNTFSNVNPSSWKPLIEVL